MNRIPKHRKKRGPKRRTKMMPKQEKKENPSIRELRRNVERMSKPRTGLNKVQSKMGLNKMPLRMEICELRMGS